MRNEAAPVSTGTAALCWHWNPGRTSRSPPLSLPLNPGGLFAPAHRRPRPRLQLRHDHRGSRLRPIRDKILRITSTYARSAGTSMRLRISNPIGLSSHPLPMYAGRASFSKRRKPSTTNRSLPILIGICSSPMRAKACANPDSTSIPMEPNKAPWISPTACWSSRLKLSLSGGASPGKGVRVPPLLPSALARISAGKAARRRMARRGPNGRRRAEVIPPIAADAAAGEFREEPHRKVLKAGTDYPFA